MRLLGLSGSLREDSYNTRLLRAAAELLPPEAELVVWEDLGEVPPYDEDTDVDPAPDAVERLRDAVATADGVLIATPEYNASVPGQLKNALDWTSRPFPDNAFRGKAVAVVGASTGLFGAVWSQAELRKVLGTIGASVLDEELPVGMAEEAFDENGRLRDGEQQERLRAIVTSLVARAEQGEHATAHDDDGQRFARDQTTATS